MKQVACGSSVILPLLAAQVQTIMLFNVLTIVFLLPIGEIC